VKSLRSVTFVTALIVVILDQVTKHWALNHLGDGHVDEIVGSLRLNLAYNTGMAFAKGQGIGPFIAVAGLLVVVFLLVGLRRDTRPGALFVGMVAGGAAGNIADRLFRGDAWLHGAVIDFIDLQWWPIFNLADAAIVIGAGSLVVSSLRPQHSGQGDAGEASVGGE